MIVAEAKAAWLEAKYVDGNENRSFITYFNEKYAQGTDLGTGFIIPDVENDKMYIYKSNNSKEIEFTLENEEEGNDDMCHFWINEHEFICEKNSTFMDIYRFNEC